MASGRFIHLVLFAPFQPHRSRMLFSRLSVPQRQLPTQSRFDLSLGSRRTAAATRSEAGASAQGQGAGQSAVSNLELSWGCLGLVGQKKLLEGQLRKSEWSEWITSAAC